MSLSSYAQTCSLMVVSLLPSSTPNAAGNLASSSLQRTTAKVPCNEPMIAQSKEKYDRHLFQDIQSQNLGRKKFVSNKLIPKTKSNHFQITTCSSKLHGTKIIRIWNTKTRAWDVWGMSRHPTEWKRCGTTTRKDQFMFKNDVSSSILGKLN